MHQDLTISTINPQGANMIDKEEVRLSLKSI
jgi:hypothetical protein